MRIKLTEYLRQYIFEQASRSFLLPSQTYPMGIYSINKIGGGMEAIDNALEEIKSFALRNRGQQVGIQIESGESNVTNYDREKFPDGGGTPLPKGELARLRGLSLQNYLKTKLGEMVKSGILDKMPIIPEPKIVLGKEDYKKGVDNPKDPKYLADQYIKLNFYVSGKSGDSIGLLPTRRIADISKCLFDMVITFSYNHGKNRPKGMDAATFGDKFHCRGTHVCDKAFFDVYLGNVKIGEINFNNRSSTEGRVNGMESDELKKLKKDNPAEFNRRHSRTATIVVSGDMVQKILGDKVAQKNQYITLRLHCKGDECHTSAPEVKVSMGGKVVFEQSCVLLAGGEQYTPKPIRLLKMDLCGKNIEKILLPVDQQPPFVWGVDS